MHCELTVPGGSCVSCISQFQATQAHRCAMSVQSQVDHESPREASLRLWNSWQIWTIQDPRKTWLVTGSLFTARWEMQSLGRRLQWSPLCSNSGCCTHASLPPTGESLKQLPACSPLVFARAQSFVGECTRGHSAELERSRGKGLCFSLSLCHSIGLSCFVTVVPSECPQGIQPLYLP